MILDYMFTYGGPELFMLATFLVVTPLFYSLFLRRVQWKYRLASIAAVWLVALVVAFGDVCVIAIEGRHLCEEEAGLHVHRIEIANGFLGASSIEFWKTHGFEYVEFELRRGGVRRYKTMDGEITQEDVGFPISRYELRFKSSIEPQNFRRVEAYVVDRQDQSRLGALVSFTEYPGWIDRLLLGILGMTWTPPSCFGNGPPRVNGHHFTEVDLIRAVLVPPKNG